MTQVAASTRALIPATPRWHALSTACGLLLHAYRFDHVSGRIERALEREGVADERSLISLLRRDSAARARFRRALAISVTGRFRDPHQFDHLRETVLPKLLDSTGSLRIWSAGCSNGLELYSLAAVLDRMGALDRATFLGSDVLAENIESARAGGGDTVPPSPALMARMRFEVRDLVSGGVPEGNFHLILCRNFAIYLGAAERDALMARLVGSLARGGVLMLGRSERLLTPEAQGLEAFGPNTYRRVS